MSRHPSTTLLRRNRDFRFLWLGQVVSQLGDWFNAVAVYALLLELTGSATAVAWMMVVQLLPVAVLGPVAGVVVDLLDRRRVMIAADLLRGAVIPGLLLVRDAGDVWLAYAVMAAAVAATAFFEPARSATIPSIVERDDLLTANAIGTATWSVMLAVGAALGGLVSTLIGRNAAFAVNAVSFFASAVFISRVRVARSAPARPGPHAAAGLGDLVEGFRYIRGHAPVAALTLVKAGWALAGGALLLLTVYGQRVFPIGGSAAAGIGVLYAARGGGALLGAIGTRRWFHGDPARLRRAVGPAYFAVGSCYILLGLARDIWTAALTVVAAHVFGALLWVASSVLLQLAVPDRFRGRVFAAELAALTLMSSIMSYATAWGLDRGGLSPQLLSVVIGAAFALPGAAWFYVEAMPGRREMVAAGEMPPEPPVVVRD